MPDQTRDQTIQAQLAARINNPTAYLPGLTIAAGEPVAVYARWGALAIVHGVARGEIGLVAREDLTLAEAERDNLRGQLGALQGQHDPWKRSAEDRLGDLTKARHEIDRQDALLTQAYDHNTETQDDRDRIAAELASANQQEDPLAELLEISDEMVNVFLRAACDAGAGAYLSGGEGRLEVTDEHVRAGLAAALVASGWRPEDDDPRHVIEFRQDGWTIKHPLSCRPKLFECPVNRAAEQDLTERPAALGRFVCSVNVNDIGDRLYIGDRIEAAQRPDTEGGER